MYIHFFSFFFPLIILPQTMWLGAWISSKCLFEVSPGIAVMKVSRHSLELLECNTTFDNICYLFLYLFTNAFFSNSIPNSFLLL